MRRTETRRPSARRARRGARCLLGALVVLAELSLAPRAGAALVTDGEIRLRHEGIDGQFRSVARLSEQDAVTFLRTRVRVASEARPVGFVLELLDGRQFAADRGSAVNAAAVNTLEVLQAQLRLAFGAGETPTDVVRLGRFTLDLGSRRLVARNRYRNTINAFTGLDWEHRGEALRGRAFVAWPNRPRPLALEDVLDNEIAVDEAGSGLAFQGLEVATDRAFGEVAATLLHLRDVRGEGRRDLWTAGLRLHRPAAPGGVGYELELARQTGERRLPDRPTSQRHRAWFGHASVGWRPGAVPTLLLRAALDAASGDDDPADGRSGRFDTLFGARRFEYGPTGLYGAIARANVVSPELRFDWTPRLRGGTTLRWRGAWRRVDLESARDAWVPAGVADPSGAAGTHVGDQFETALALGWPERGLQLELGAVRLEAGRFVRRASPASGPPTTYGYAELRWRW
ncbi:MAG: alginate export family protein [Pseudomonadales bacterium]|nr:alginate export family protein [Pseudomonadales bacterium]